MEKYKDRYGRFISGKEMADNWLSVDENLPDDGDYEVKVVNNGEEVVTKRRLIKGRWFGGCRPFTDREKVTHYKANDV